MRKMPRWWITLCALLLVALCLTTPNTARAAAPQLRALLIGCENFRQLTSLAPTPSNNVSTLSEVLTQMHDSLASLHTAIDTIGSEDELRAAIAQSFADARPDDICLLYISTHGRFRPEAPEYPAVITLANASTEFEIDGARLQALLDDTPGTKVVLIDACNSGAMVGKGVTPNLNDQPLLPFHRPDYKVLTSAGGNELSWNWSEIEQNRPFSLGSSYFAKALAGGLGLNGEYGADLNQDGDITLKEIYLYLLDNHGSSTVHVYPQDDNFVLFHYDPSANPVPDPSLLLSDIAFPTDALSADEPAISFSFTALQPVRVQYQLVYTKNDAWDWDNAEFFLDTYESLPGTDVFDGTVQPGIKERCLHLSDIKADTSGYALLQIMTLGDTGPEVRYSKLLAVVPTTGNPDLRIDAFGEQFQLAPTDELAFQVVHGFPLQLTVGIYDAQGKRIRRLATDQPSRPLHLMPEGSLFYWNGCDELGKRVPAGVYELRASAYVGNTKHEAHTRVKLLN